MYWIRLKKKYSQYCHLHFTNNKHRLFICFLVLIFTIKLASQFISYSEVQRSSIKINLSSEKHLKHLNFWPNNFNEVVLEEENVGIEEGGVDLSLHKDNNDKRGSGTDLNAALEDLSHHQNEKEHILLLQNINNAVTGLKRNFSLPIYSKKYLRKDTGSNSNKYFVWNKFELEKNGFWNYRKFSIQEMEKLSNLGKRLFLNLNIGVPFTKEFVIYVYKFGKRLERRFIKQFGKKVLDPFRNCSVKNCRITYNSSDFDTADAVLFHLHLIEGPPTQLQRKNLNQRWVWLSDESIFNTFMKAKNNKLEHYNNIFNWSMTYRSDSDIPVPYGRTVPLLGNMAKINLDVFSEKNKTVAIMSSSCGSRNARKNYVEELGKYIDVDTYGKCGKLKCPGHYTADCPLLNSYKFYLAFENSNCKEYITEKSWWNAFEKKSVPIVMGTSKSDYIRMFPPHSFIHVEDFKSPKELAQYIKFLSENRDAYNQLHAWRSLYRIVNEHGYFKSPVFHYCRLCEALNYNTQDPKTYAPMKAFWNVTRDCNLKKLLLR